MARNSLLILPPFLLLTVASITAKPAQAIGRNGRQHFVLVHGLGHGAWCWYKITTLLQQRGHTVTAIDLTSNGINKVVADDVTSISQYLQPLTQFLANNNDKVILVGHSIGGGAISYAMELFSQKIVKAIFLAALMPRNNETYVPTYVVQSLGSSIANGVVIQNFANGPTALPTSVYINLTSGKDYFYNESPPKDVSLALSLLNPTPFAPCGEVLNLTSTKYGSIPRIYIRTTLDRAIPPSLQATIIQKNPPAQVFTIQQSDHSAFFSKPLDLAVILSSIAST